MANIQQGSIYFTVNTDEEVGGFSTKRSNSNVLDNRKYSVEGKQQLINTGDDAAGYSVNAIDIDWNAAELPNANPSDGGKKTIYTSGELLKLIDDIQKEIYVLTAAVIALSE